MPRQIVLIRHGDDPPDDRVVTSQLRNGSSRFSCAPSRVRGWGCRGRMRGGRSSTVDRSTCPRKTSIRPCTTRPTGSAHAWPRGRPFGALPRGRADRPCPWCRGGTLCLSGPRIRLLPDLAHREGSDFLPETQHMTQAHFHTFAIPEGTVHLATSPLLPNQAFRYGDRTYASSSIPKSRSRASAACKRTIGRPMASPAPRAGPNRMRSWHSMTRARPIGSTPSGENGSSRPHLRFGRPQSTGLRHPFDAGRRDESPMLW